MLSKELVELANKISKQKSETQIIELKVTHEDCPKRLYDSLSLQPEFYHIYQSFCSLSGDAAVYAYATIKYCKCILRRPTAAVRR